MDEPRVYVGFHGTNEQSLASIRAEGFRKSENDDDWLGFGVYFFIEGISCPIENAKEWATCCSWDNAARRYIYDRLAVLEVLVSSVKVLDCTDQAGLSAFNRVRDHVLAVHDREFLPQQSSQHDRAVWNVVAEAMGLDIVVHNLYIKTRDQRMNRIDSKVPNTTVMCVREPACIDMDSLSLRVAQDIEKIGDRNEIG